MTNGKTMEGRYDKVPEITEIEMTKDVKFVVYMKMDAKFEDRNNMCFFG